MDPSKDACKLTKFDSITVIDGELHFFKDGWAKQFILHCLTSKLGKTATWTKKWKCWCVTFMCWSTEITGRCPVGAMKDPRDHLLFLRTGQLCRQSLTLPLRTFWPRNCTSSQVLKLQTVYKVTLMTQPRVQTVLYWSLLSLGTRFWVYTGKSVLGPRSIEKLGLPTNIEKVEGALQRGKGKVLLFSGENFWRWVKIKKILKLINIIN